MRGLAELAMRGPRQAILLSVLFTSIPVMFWLSAAIISLVILRHGVDQGLKVLIWALLPGIAWAATGQYSVLMGLVATGLLALSLRTTVSWQKTLLALLPVGGLMAFMLSIVVPGQVTQLTEMVMELLTSVLKQAGKTPADLSDNLEPLVHFGVIGMLAWFNLVNCVLGLVLARSWQSMLYNPGGFQKELHSIRFTATLSMTLLALALAGLVLSPFMVILLPLASLPLFVAGLSMVHALVWLRKMGSLPLIMFYVLVILFTQLAYPIIVLTACLDSLFDFRKRVRQKVPQD
ncbi:hypothetical protein [Candidatus Sororendozoicomonas aggregata]|uniref:hypothetical protein n=1 Tax=Candidatus Sororendozoicomonas aggregata TaxID=3073239 RepID=UPI002ECFAEEB